MLVVVRNRLRCGLAQFKLRTHFLRPGCTCGEKSDNREGYKSFSCTVRVMPAHHPAVTSQAIMRLRRGKISVALLLMVVCSPDDAPRTQRTKNRDTPDRRTQPPLPIKSVWRVLFLLLDLDHALDLTASFPTIISLIVYSCLFGFP